MRHSLTKVELDMAFADKPSRGRGKGRGRGVARQSQEEVNLFGQQKNPAFQSPAPSEWKDPTKEQTSRKGISKI